MATWWRVFLIRAIPLFRLTALLILVFVAVSYGYGASLPTASARHTADEVLLVYNADSPISAAIAKEYAGKRGVTKAVAIRCADSAVSNTMRRFRWRITNVGLPGQSGSFFRGIKRFSKRQSETEHLHRLPKPKRVMQGERRALAEKVSRFTLSADFQ
jgi:hypothetical protein